MKKIEDNVLIFYIIISILSMVFIIGIETLLIKTNNIFIEKIYIFRLYSIITLILILYYFFKYNKKEQYFKMKKKLKFKGIMSYFSYIYIINILITVIIKVSIILLKFQSSPDKLVKPNIFSLILWTGFLGPIIEEIAFRGIIMNDLKKYGYKTSILVSSALFGLYHVNIEQIIPAFAIGIILAYVSIKYSLKYAVILHIINNLIPIMSYTTIEYFMKYDIIFLFVFSVLVIMLIILGIINLIKKQYTSIFRILKLDKEDKNSLILFCKNNYSYLIIILIIVILNLCLSYRFT